MIKAKLLSLLGWAFVNALGRTLRIKEVNPVNYKKDRVIFAFWHGEQFIPCFHHRNQKVAIMSSLSKDGEIQTGILNLFNYSVIRGSTTRGAQRALVEMIRRIKTGHNGAFAVDGPKGPYHKVKSGIIYLAQKAKKPIIPVSSSPE